MSTTFVGTTPRSGQESGLGPEPPAGPGSSSRTGREARSGGQTAQMRRVSRWVSITATLVLVAVIIALVALAIGSLR